MVTRYGCWNLEEDPNGDLVGYEVYDSSRRNLEKLIKAVLMFYSVGPWDSARREQWKELTGEDEASTKTLCDLARGILEETDED